MQLLREDISKSVKSLKWQKFRMSLRGLSTSEKLKKLRKYSKTHKSKESRIVVQNYKNALKRAGLLS